MTLLVTGGAGFIGSHFIERALRHSDERIVCLDNYNNYYAPAFKRSNVKAFADHPRVTMIEESFCRTDAMEDLFQRHRVKRVLHLGAYAGVRPSITSPLVYEENNVRGTLVLLEAVRRHPVERFVFASSSTVYGRGAVAPFEEDAPLGAPMSPYGATKRAAELLCFTYADLHQVPIVCVRPFSVYGCRARPNLAMSIFANAILSGYSLPIFGDGTVKRDFTHVDDICDGLAAALVVPSAVGEAVNVGHSEPVELRYLISMLEDAFGHTAKVEYLPAAAGDMPLTHADLTKAARLLGYSPRIALTDGIEQFVKWFSESRVA